MTTKIGEHIAQATQIKLNVSNLMEALKLRGRNFIGTPNRVGDAWMKFLHPEPFELTTFPLEGVGGMIAVKDHECWSFCPHHLLPVRYKVRVGYIPEETVLGLSKLNRIADAQMCKMPLQEDLAEMIAQPIIDCLKPKGVGVVVHGEHLCMKMRGVESTH